MKHGELCEADQILPDGNANYEINNCGGYDVFKCIRGKPSISIWYLTNLVSFTIESFNLTK